MRASRSERGVPPPSRRVEAFLEMLTAERGAARLTVAAYRNDLCDLAAFLGRRNQAIEEADAAGLLARLRDDGYHAGLALGRWYPQLASCLTVAVTEKRTRAEIDGLAAAFAAALHGVRGKAVAERR